MKRICASMLLLLSVLMISGNSYSQDALSFPDGPYLGQKPPGSTPEVFAPDIVRSEHIEGGNTFSPDLKKFYFNRRGGNIKIIRCMSLNTKIINGSCLLCHPVTLFAGL